MKTLIIFKKKNKIKININSNLEFNNLEYYIEFKSKTKKILNKIENFEKLIKKTNENYKINKLKSLKKKQFKKTKFKKKIRSSIKVK